MDDSNKPARPTPVGGIPTDSNLSTQSPWAPPASIPDSPFGNQTEPISVPPIPGAPDSSMSITTASQPTLPSTPPTTTTSISPLPGTPPPSDLGNGQPSPFSSTPWPSAPQTPATPTAAPAEPALTESVPVAPPTPPPPPMPMELPASLSTAQVPTPPPPPEPVSAPVSTPTPPPTFDINSMGLGSPTQPAGGMPDSAMAGSNSATPPTDLSHLADPAVAAPEAINPYTPPVASPASLVVPPENNAGIPPAAGGKPPKKGIKPPKIVLIILGVVILLAVAGASAYFILGIGKAQATPTPSSAPADQQPLTNPPQASVLPSPTALPEITPLPTATGSATTGFGSVASPSPSTTSALDLLKARQSSTPSASTAP